MITGLTVAGSDIDSCYVLADVAVTHGRRSVTDGPTASTAAIAVLIPPGPLPEWGCGDRIVLHGDSGPVFTGRLVSRRISHWADQSGQRWAEVSLQCVGPLAGLGARPAGDNPWPQESGLARAAHILAASGTNRWATEGTLDYEVLPHDVDASDALALISALAADTGAAVFDTPDGTVIYQTLSGRAWPLFALRWSDIDSRLRWSQIDPALKWSGPQPSWETPSPAAVRPVEIPCSGVVWEPEWTSDEGSVVNDLRVGYGIAAAGGSEQPEIRLSDHASIGRHGRRYLSIATQLAAEGDATARASHILTTQSRERWELGSVTVELDVLTDTQVAAVTGLLCGRHVLLKGLPGPAPASDWVGICEGWTYLQTNPGTGPVATMILALTEPGLSLAMFRWADYPIAYIWSDHPNMVTWNDLDTLATLTG